MSWPLLSEISCYLRFLCMDESIWIVCLLSLTFWLVRLQLSSILNEEAIIIIMKDFVVKVLSWIKYNCGPTGLGNYTIYKNRQKKTTKAKATNKMYNEIIKINDNNLKWKWIFMQSKSKIKKYSYLPRIDLCELVNEAKQRLSMQ